MKAILAVLVIAALPLFAQGPFGELSWSAPHHPFRKVGEKYYDLRPAYSWIAARQRAGVMQPPNKTSNWPMPEWFGYPKQFEVKQVLDGGLLVSNARRAYFLTNYPAADKAVDGQQITFLAIKSGTYKYTDTQGANRTIELYDYGTPYNPADLAKSRTNAPAAKTNAPAVATNAPAGK